MRFSLQMRRLSVIFIISIAIQTLCITVFAERVVREFPLNSSRELAGWRLTGKAWGIVATPRPGVPAHPHPESQAGGESAVGTIRSPNFVVKGDLIRFLSNGWDGEYGDQKRNEYFLKSSQGGKVLRYAPPPGQDGFEPVMWLVSDLRGRRVYFEAVDRDKGKAFAWLGFDRLEELQTDIPSSKSQLFSIPLPPMENTWQILHHDGYGRTVPAYLSSLGFGEQGMGSIVSPPFVVRSPDIRITICGWSGRNGDRRLSKAELIDASSKSVLRESSPPLTDSLTPVVWQVGDLTGRTVQVRLADQDNNSSFAWMGLGEVDARPSYFVNFAKPGEISGVGMGLEGWRPGGAAPESYCESGGIPFLCASGVLLNSGGTRTIPVGLRAKRLYLAGFTGSYDQGEPVWGDPNDHSHQLFIGDHLGSLVLDYSDGSSVKYPLLYGYSSWWYRPLQNADQPFDSDLSARRILNQSLSLQPTDAGSAGAFMGVITPRAVEIRDIRIEDNPDKAGVPIISAITLQPVMPPPADLLRLPHDRITRMEADWLDAHSLNSDADSDEAIQTSLKRLRGLLYTTAYDFPAHLPVSIPPGYIGPHVRFRGNAYADILTSMFYYNVEDILNKVDANGMYHTSTSGAPSWGGYTGVGSWQTGVGSYYSQSWSRDLGRSMQEITELGFLKKTDPVADYCFREAERWAHDASLKYEGVQLPAHWSRILNLPTPTLGDGVFENDGHGLIMLFTYKLWQREPHPNEWLRLHWQDILAAGDWIQWQFDHPQISGATDVLQTDSECAGGIGKAKYADFLCEEGLRAYATMADSIGETAAALRWRATSDKLLAGMEKEYFVNDPLWGPTWTLLPAGWPNRSTNLGPLIILADRRGFAPEDNIAGWYARDLSAYLRLAASYRPFGYYGTAMGYGQGFVTQAALLLDRMHDASVMLQWLAKLTYYPRYKPFIVPEGCELSTKGVYWHRTGDLGNGVQEGEAVKAIRLVLGLDDDRPDVTQLIPRLPFSWSGSSVSGYPVLTIDAGNKRVTRRASYKLKRIGSSLTLSFQADGPIAAMHVRFGPFASPDIRVELNGHAIRVRIVHSGDSDWAWLPVMRKVSRFQCRGSLSMRSK